MQHQVKVRDCEPSNLPQPNYQNQSYSNVGMFLKWECLALIKPPPKNNKLHLQEYNSEKCGEKTHKKLILMI